MEKKKNGQGKYNGSGKRMVPKGEHKMFLRIPCRQPVTKRMDSGYSVNPGNQHDSRTFKSLYDKIKDIGIQYTGSRCRDTNTSDSKVTSDDGITITSTV